MAYLTAENGTGFQGDILSLNYIQPTVEAKSLWIPGVTCAFDVTVNGQTAYYYSSETFDISEGEAGRKLDLSVTGAKRHSFDMDRSYAIGGIIPMVGKDTISEDIVGRKLMDSAKGVIALDNAKGITALLAAAQTGTASGTTAYDKVVNAVADFNEANKVVVEYDDADTNREHGKAKGGWIAKTLIVGPKFYAELQASKAFVEGNANFTVNEAVIGTCAGLDVVYSTDLPSTVNFVVMSPEGFLAPKGVSATEVFGQVEGRPGAALAQAEMVYGYKVLDAKQIMKF